jgi:predicted enzyme related to lactoylglutathione lyase
MEAEMTEQDRYIPGVPCWLDMTPPDPDAAAAFYGDLFGWEVEDVMPAGAPGRYLVGRLGGRDVAAIGSPPQGAPPAAAWTTYVWVESADATADRVTAAGGRVLSPPQDVGDAGRMAVCADTEGATFCLWQAGGHRGAGVVNEHGSVNFNDLHARDRRAAEAFYGAVFGWEVLDLGGPGGVMWTLPGYGAFLERRSPGLLDNMSRWGRPRASRTWSPASTPPTTARPPGASRSLWTTPTRSPPAPPSSAGGWSSRRSTPRGCG